MGFTDETVRFNLDDSNKKEISETLTDVYKSLNDKGYNPINQIVGYVLSGDPAYVPRYNNARNQIRKYERDEIVEELVQADVTGRIKDIEVQGQESSKQKTKHFDEVDLAQMSLFDTVKDDDVLNELKELDISHMTPMDAMNKLYQLQNKLRNRW